MGCCGRMNDHSPRPRCCNSVRLLTPLPADPAGFSPQSTRTAASPGLLRQPCRTVVRPLSALRVSFDHRAASSTKGSWKLTFRFGIIKTSEPQSGCRLADGSTAPISAFHNPDLFSRKPTCYCLSIPASQPRETPRSQNKPQLHRLLDAFDKSLDQVGPVLNERLGEDLDLAALLIEAIPVDAIVA